MIREEIQRAIGTHAIIEIEYVDWNGKSSVRRLSDVQYSLEYGDSHISAFCHSRQAQRTFRIDRIQKLTFVEAGVVAPKGASEFSQTSESIPEPSSESKPKVKEVYQFNPDKPIFQLYGIEY